MAKSFIFRGVDYNDLNDLGNAMATYFASAVTEVYEAPKKFVKFIKRYNKNLAHLVADAIAYSKYKNNAITFIIYSLCNDKRIVINGTKYDFKTFAYELGKNPELFKAGWAFIEDHGITKTYGFELDKKPEFREEMMLVENNIESQLAKDYLINYFAPNEALPALETYFTNLFINSEERFRRAVQMSRDNRFKLVLARKFDLKSVISFANKDNPLFDALKLLNQIFEEDDLAKLIDNTFYWWLLDRYDRYVYSPEYKYLKIKLKQIEKERRSYGDKIPYAQLVDLSSRLYDIYINFAIGCHDGKIIVNPQEDVEAFTLNKAYARTYICLDFMSDHIVKLSKAEEDEFTDSDDEIAADGVRDVPDDGTMAIASEISAPTYPQKLIDEQPKVLNALKRFSTLLMWLSVIFTLLSGAVFGLAISNLLDSFITIIDLDYIPIISAGAAMLFAIIVGGIVRIKSGRSARSLDDYNLLVNLSSGISLTTAQTVKLYEIQGQEDVLLAKSMKYCRLISAFAAIFLGVASAVLGIYACTILMPILGKDFLASYEKFEYIYLAIGGCVGLLWGLFRKRKGAFTALFIALLSIGGVIAMAYFL